VAAGADTSQGFYRVELPPQDARYWPPDAVASPNPPALAVDLLKQSIEDDAIVIGIGPLTNLYLLEKKHPGILQDAKLFLMGGYVYPVRAGFPVGR
jgi:inosine-uridine nucleoside N-ribohydrolase